MRPLNWLLDRSMGCPGPEGHWTAWLTVLFHSSNLIIAMADLAVPAIILANWKYRRDGIGARAIWTVLLYFPVKCASRLVRVLEITGPPYHLTALIDATMAVLAVYSVYQLGPFLRNVMRLPSRDEVHKLNVLLQREVSEKDLRRIEIEERNAKLLGLLDEAHRALAPDVWLGDKHAALDRIAVVINEGR